MNGIRYTTIKCSSFLLFALIALLRHLSNACLYYHNESINNLYALFAMGL